MAGALPAAGYPLPTAWHSAAARPLQPARETPERPVQRPRVDPLRRQASVALRAACFTNAASTDAAAARAGGRASVSPHRKPPPPIKQPHALGRPSVSAVTRSLEVMLSRLRWTDVPAAYAPQSGRPARGVNVLLPASGHCDSPSAVCASSVVQCTR